MRIQLQPRLWDKVREYTIKGNMTGLDSYDKRVCMYAKTDGDTISDGYKMVYDNSYAGFYILFRTNYVDPIDIPMEVCVPINSRLYFNTQTLKVEDADGKEIIFPFIYNAIDPETGVETEMVEYAPDQKKLFKSLDGIEEKIKAVPTNQEMLDALITNLVKEQNIKALNSISDLSTGKQIELTRIINSMISDLKQKEDDRIYESADILGKVKFHIMKAEEAEADTITNYEAASIRRLYLATIVQALFDYGLIETAINVIDNYNVEPVDPSSITKSKRKTVEDRVLFQMVEKFRKDQDESGTIVKMTPSQEEFNYDLDNSGYLI